VYRATDTKLGRDVALKVLPAEMAASPERLERFRLAVRELVPLGQRELGRDACGCAQVERARAGSP